MASEKKHKQELSFTSGPILKPLLLFALPVLGAQIIQTLYGSVDLMIVGRFGSAADVSAVANGVSVMNTITWVISSLSIGTTVLLGQRIGSGDKESAGDIISAAIWLFGFLGLEVMVLLPFLAVPLCTALKVPELAFTKCVQYITVCSYGAVFIVAYNVLGSVFRGMGDSRTPLLSVAIASVLNIAGDYYLVAIRGMASLGAAIATVLAQAISVIICIVIISIKGLPFSFGRKNLRINWIAVRSTLNLGLPITFQSLLVSMSFIVIQVIVNDIGLIASAGMGVAEKLSGFIMLVPNSFSQALSAFVAQNVGARDYKRAEKALVYSIAASFSIALVMAYMSFFHGDLMAGLFSKDPEVIKAGWDYLRAYAIDTLMISFMFCFVGYFNGCGLTRFDMVQGIVGAFGVRVPMAFLMSRVRPVSLFLIGLSTPASSLLQNVLCFWYYFKKRRERAAKGSN